MCLAVPCKIVHVDNSMTGTIDFEGVKRDVCLVLLENAKVGDYVIVHAGYAIHKIDEREAEESLKILRDVASNLRKKAGNM